MNAIEMFRHDLGKTTQRFDAIGLAEGLLIDAETAEIPDDGSYTYDDDDGSAERYMLAGGGPSAWAVFVTFGTEVTAYIEYADADGTTLVPIPSVLAPELRSMLRRDSRARNAR